MNERICFSILTTRKYLKLEFWFQVSSMYFLVIRIEKQIRSFTFLVGVLAQQFCFEIYWPLDIWAVCIYSSEKAIISKVWLQNPCRYSSYRAISIDEPLFVCQMAILSHLEFYRCLYELRWLITREKYSFMHFHTLKNNQFWIYHP